jgi:phasin family protein
VRICGTAARAYSRLCFRKETMMQNPQFFEFYRAGVRTMTDVMQASMEGAERLQRQQLDLLHTAVEENVKSARELANAKSFDEMVAMQMGYWTRMWGNASSTAMSTMREGLREMTSQPSSMSAQQHKSERKSA